MLENISESEKILSYYAVDYLHKINYSPSTSDTSDLKDYVSSLIGIEDVQINNTIKEQFGVSLYPIFVKDFNSSLRYEDTINQLKGEIASVLEGKIYLFDNDDLPLPAFDLYSRRLLASGNDGLNARYKDRFNYIKDELLKKQSNERKYQQLVAFNKWMKLFENEINKINANKINIQLIEPNPVTNPSPPSPLNPPTGTPPTSPAPPPSPPTGPPSNPTNPPLPINPSPPTTPPGTSTGQPKKEPVVPVLTLNKSAINATITIKSLKFSIRNSDLNAAINPNLKKLLSQQLPQGLQEKFKKIMEKNITVEELIKLLIKEINDQTKKNITTENKFKPASRIPSTLDYVLKRNYHIHNGIPGMSGVIQINNTLGKVAEIKDSEESEEDKTKKLNTILGKTPSVSSLMSPKSLGIYQKVCTSYKPLQ